MVLSSSVRLAYELAKLGHRVVFLAPGRREVAARHLRTLGAAVREDGLSSFEGGGRVRIVSDVREIRGMVADEVFIPADTLPAAFVDIVPALAPGGDTVTYELERAGV